MTKLTVLETQVMKAIPQDNFYEEGFESVLWSDIFASEVADLDAKKVRGVMSSLGKKNMIWVAKASETGQEHPTMGLTAEGITWLKENCENLDENGYFVKKSENSNNEGNVVEMSNEKNQVEEAVIENEVEVIENVEVENQEIEAAEVTVEENVETTENTEETPQENEAPQEESADNKRRHGIGVQFYVNDELQEVYPSIQAAAREVKKYLNRETMPYTLIHKSIRDYIDYTHTDGSVLKFRFENEADKKAEYKTRQASTGGSRGAGRLVNWYENGEFKQQFPSIKAAVEFMKQHLGLPHNPYTAVQKSLNENQDWNQHSFGYADEAVEAPTAVAVEEATTDNKEEIVEIENQEIELTEEAQA